MSTMPPPVRHVLLVDDSLADSHVITQVCSNLGSIHHVTDGSKALDFLRQAPPFEDAERPALILLDLNLPRKNGFEVLTEIKADRTLRAIPVIVLSSSKAEEDVMRAYDLGANTYVVKPPYLPNLRVFSVRLEEWWFQTAKLPQGVP